MKKILFLVFLLGLLLTPKLLNKSVKPHATQCPPGSYSIDEHVCKKEPTGCPYGDSLPLEKCGGETNPTRDYFDAQGNRYDYQGNLEQPVTPNQVETDYSWGK